MNKAIRRSALMRRSRHGQAGQSTTEFVVLSLVLLPLFLIIPILGKYLDLAQSTEMASRYVAFEGTVRNTSSSWKTDAQLADEVRRRFFSTSDAPVKTNDTVGDYWSYRNPLWTDTNANTLLPDFTADVTVSTSTTANSAPVAAAYSGGLGFSLPSTNYYTGTVTVKPANIPALKGFAEKSLDGFAAINLSISKSTTLLADAWTAPNPAKVKTTVQNAGIVAYPIEGVEVAAIPFRVLTLPMFEKNLDVNDVNPELVPCDRLTPACTPVPPATP